MDRIDRSEGGLEGTPPNLAPYAQRAELSMPGAYSPKQSGSWKRWEWERTSTACEGPLPIRPDSEHYAVVWRLGEQLSQRCCIRNYVRLSAVPGGALPRGAGNSSPAQHRD